MNQLRKHSTKVLPLAFLLIVSLVSMAAPQSFTGTISDSMCGAKHMMPGKTDAECTRECAKADSKYVLLVDKKVYTLSGRQADLASLAGKRVRVAGERHGDTIAVESIAVAGR